MRAGISTGFVDIVTPTSSAERLRWRLMVTECFRAAGMSPMRTSLPISSLRTFARRACSCAFAASDLGIISDRFSRLVFTQ